MLYWLILRHQAEAHQIFFFFSWIRSEAEILRTTATILLSRGRTYGRTWPRSKAGFRGQKTKIRISCFSNYRKDSVFRITSANLDIVKTAGGIGSGCVCGAGTLDTSKCDSLAGYLWTGSCMVEKKDQVMLGRAKWVFIDALRFVCGQVRLSA